MTVTGPDFQTHLAPLTADHAPVAAELHLRGISTGFLSSLGPRFLRQLYTAMPACPSGFGWVCLDDDGRALGFIACTESTRRLYKEAMRRRGLFMAASVVRFLLRPSFLRRMIQTLRYPAQVGEDLPPAEVLSIAVDVEARRRGVGAKLMTAATEEFRRRNIRRVKVAVWAGNKSANTFYRRYGFTLAVTRLHHGLEMNIYTVEL